MFRLRVKQVAEDRGVSMYKLWTQTKLSHVTVRQYWHNKSQRGKPLVSVNLVHLGVLADYLGVKALDLIEEIEDEVAV